MPAPDAVIQAVDHRLETTLDELGALVRIPGVSAPGFDPRQLERSAEAVADLASGSGLEGVEVLRTSGAPPYVVGERAASEPGAPRVLVYAHHDVQPPGRAERWRSPPFEPTLRDDGRLYGRGVVDDKAGIALYLAALRGWLEARGAPPVHLKLLVEGEEEVGSAHLAGFLREHRRRLDADVLVLSDTQNLATGLPSLTTSLRGIVQLDVTVRALDHPLHSGMWGGALPDAATALSRLLARLSDDAGAPAIPGLYDDVPELDAEQRRQLEALPFDESEFRRDAGLLDGVALAGEPGRTVYERLWHRPAVSVTALESVPLAQAANQLADVARARVGVRLAPGQDPARVAACVERCLAVDPPSGVRVETFVAAAVPGWKTRDEGPCFDAARRALAAGYGREPVAIGCGGSIPFVAPFGAEMGGIPQLLLGLEDPPCNAHGENESLHLGDFQRAARAAAHLLAELGRR